MNVSIDRKRLCKELEMLSEILTPQEVCYKLLSNHLDFYYIAHCPENIPPKILQVCGESIKKSLRNIRTAVHTIDYLSDLLSKPNLEFVFIKTYRPLPYVPNDIDIFVREEDFPTLMKLLKANKFRIVRRGAEIRCYREKMTRVDVYSSIVYAGIRFSIIEDLLLLTRVSVKFLGNHDIIIPSPSLDALLLLLHDILGHKAINYIDYLYIKHFLLGNFNSDIPWIILNSTKAEINYIKKCLALFLSKRKDVFNNIAEFPLQIEPSLVFNIINDICLRKKILYGSSLLVDHFLQLYNKYIYSIPVKLRNIVQTVLFYHRLLVGDRHI